MQRLAQYNRERVIDVLTERLTFERAGVQLYDAVLRKIDQSHDPAIARMRDTTQKHRDQEKEHEEWLEAQIRALGGDAHGKTEHARLVEAESVGIQNVVLDGDPDVSHVMHALLAAELADNAGWELLVELADEAGDDVARAEFIKRLHEENKHVMYVRQCVAIFARNQILGRNISLPTTP